MQLFRLVICTRFELVTSCLSSKRSKPTELTDQVRKDWDSNPGGAFGAYTLSRRAPSTTRPSFLCGRKSTLFFDYSNYKILYLCIFSNFY